MYPYFVPLSRISLSVSTPHRSLPLPGRRNHRSLRRSRRMTLRVWPANRHTAGARPIFLEVKRRMLLVCIGRISFLKSCREDRADPLCSKFLLLLTSVVVQSWSIPCSFCDSFNVGMFSGFYVQFFIRLILVEYSFQLLSCQLDYPSFN